MKVTQQRFFSRIIAGMLLPAILTLSPAQAADAVQWDDLPKKIGGKMRSNNPENRQYRVVTMDGRTHAGSGLFFGPASVSVGEPGPPIPREQVAEIRIHRYGPLWEVLAAPAAAIAPLRSGGGGDYDFPDPFEMLLLTPVWLAITAVAAPIVLPIEGVKRLLPDRVFKVAP
jgi:hypothetical protein